MIINIYYLFYNNESTINEDEIYIRIDIIIMLNIKI